MNMPSSQALQIITIVLTMSIILYLNFLVFIAYLWNKRHQEEVTEIAKRVEEVRKRLLVTTAEEAKDSTIQELGKR